MKGTNYRYNYDRAEEGDPEVRYKVFFFYNNKLRKRIVYTLEEVKQINREFVIYGNSISKINEAGCVIGEIFKSELV